jgi:hypothetical protein
VDTSIHCDFKGDSKVTDENDLQLEKHAIQSSSIDAGIMIAVKPLLSTADASIRRKVEFDLYLTDESDSAKSNQNSLRISMRDSMKTAFAHPK